MSGTSQGGGGTWEGMNPDVVESQARILSGLSGEITTPMNKIEGEVAALADAWHGDGQAGSHPGLGPAGHVGELDLRQDRGGRPRARARLSRTTDSRALRLVSGMLRRAVAIPAANEGEAARQPRAKR